jgi:hypothetical protein
MDHEEAIAYRLELLAIKAKAARTARQDLWDEVHYAVEDGVTWQQVGLILGVTRQAAHERFTKPPPGQLI